MFDEEMTNKIFRKDSKFTNFVNKYGKDEDIDYIKSMIMYYYSNKGAISFEKSADVLEMDLHKFYDFLDDLKLEVSVYNPADIAKALIKHGLISEEKMIEKCKEMGIDYNNY